MIRAQIGNPWPFWPLAIRQKPGTKLPWIEQKELQELFQ